MRKIIKQIVYFLFLTAMLPVYLFMRALAALFGETKAFQGVSQFMALLPGGFGAYCRSAYYRLAMSSCSGNCRIEFLTTFVSGNTVLGKHVYIGSGCNIGHAEIGDDCLLGSGVHVMSGRGQHRFDDPDRPIRLQGGQRIVVRIGRDCWLGNASLVMADVGEGSVVAAGSVVVDPVEPYSIVAGNPAKVIGSRR